MKNQRKQFEQWCIDDLMPSEFSSGYLFQRDADGDYKFDWIGHRWTAFRAGRVMQAEEDARIVKAHADPSISGDFWRGINTAAEAISTTILTNLKNLKGTE